MENQLTPRRRFLNLIASSLGLAAITPMSAQAKNNSTGGDLEVWFNRLTGKHKMLFDTITPNNGFQVLWPLTFLETHNQTGTPDNELNAIVVLRSKAVPMALDDRMWRKYKLGKFYKVIDPLNNVDADRNLYWDPSKGEMPEEGSSIKDLMARGVMFCVCEKALTLNSSQVAKSKGLDAAQVKQEWMDSILPGIQRVPSGVWALNKAQEHGASYCYAG